MSDPTIKPGAPSEKSVARAASTGAHGKDAGILSSPDRTLLRLNKLIATPGGLSSLLSTFNYTLYLLMHLEQKAIPVRVMIQVLLKQEISIPEPGTSRVAALAGLISQTRTTLRLFGLLPLYAWARVLSAGPKPGQDTILYTTDVSQCALYMAFQALENVAFLTDNKVLPASLTARWTAKSGGTTTDLYLWSYRTWMLAIVCDLVRLGRQAQLERIKRSQRTYAQSTDLAVQKADREVDAQWRSAAVSPLAWLPMAYHYAAWTPTGVPGWNMGWLAVSGGIAGIQKFKTLWDATA